MAKHGNRSVSSKSGSADVLEELGININLYPEEVKNIIDEIGIGFMFAPVFHKSMRFAAIPRKQTGLRSVFNILGPLSNPATVSKQVVGVFDKNYINRLVTALDSLDTKRAMILSSNDGMDEISISDVTYATTLFNGKMEDIEINPEDYGIPMANKQDIEGGTPAYNARLTTDILSKKLVGAKLDIVLINAAAALIVDEKARDFKDGIAIAKEAIISGKAKEKLEQIIKVSKQLS